MPKNKGSKSNSRSNSQGDSGASKAAPASDAPAIDSMSVGALKKELQSYGADYSRCVEKAELRALLQKVRLSGGAGPGGADGGTSVRRARSDACLMP